MQPGTTPDEVSDSRAGRLETIRYHQEFYAQHYLFEPGTWLHRPSPFVLRAVGLLTATAPLVVVDLGSGVGRHTIPIAQVVPAGSRVVGIDLLPIAAEHLLHNAATAGVGDKVRAVVADLDSVALAPECADLFVACSSLEHVSDIGALASLIQRCQAAARVGGLHCLIIAVDRLEVGPDGHARQARVEFPLTSADATALLTRLYADWEWLDFSTGSYHVDEERDGEPYRLEATSIRLLARRRT